MKGRMANKVALVTGGGSGIGRATAIMFGREGAKVVIADIDAEGGEETLRLVKKADGEGVFVRTDVTKSSEVEALVEQAVRTYGRLDCAFNNAGIPGEVAPVGDLTEEGWEHVMRTNLTSMTFCMKYEIRQMLTQKSGAIVNNSSTQGLVAVTSAHPGYTASKHGVIGLTKSAALAYATSGIRVNAVAPGVIRTPLMDRVFETQPEVEAPLVAIHPIGRLGTTDEVAEAVLWLCSDASSFVLGHTLVVDGGCLIQ